ncbi:hypothetical protein Mapa_018201 [Marchantia paleacea]|nr:hypothetical protein Mapa_018201 [Marchantia paleacea]
MYWLYSMCKSLSYRCIRNDTLDGCKANQIASAPRTEDCVGCKRCESACPTDFLSVRVYLADETTRSMGLSY